MAKTFASICTSGGVYEQGLIAHGIKPIWGVEINPRVADVYKLNYPDSQIIVSDACKVDWSQLSCPDFLHASPSCRSFSQLNNKKEAAKDIAVAQAVSRAIAHFQPEIFTLENVTAYQDSESWTVIEQQLRYLGYKVSAKIEMMRFWGVPQKQRNRFIAIASKQQTFMLMPTNRTNYWYECIEDLISELESSELTNTQISKLTAKTKRAIANGETVLLKRNQIRNYTCAAYSTEPYCWSPTATLCTDQSENKRSKFADLVTPDGIKKLTVRCLARIQTISDSYILPDDVAIAGLVTGDSIPPLFATQMWEQILRQYRFTAQTNLDIAADKLFPQIKSDKHLSIKSFPRSKNNICDRLITKLTKTKKKNYTRSYFRHKDKGKVKFEYVKKSLIHIVEQEIESGKSDEDILLLLRGVVSNIPGDCSSRLKDNNLRPRSKTQRSLGEGTGYIVKKPIVRSGKTYDQFWFHYEIWCSGNCQKKSKYIPKRKEGEIAKLNMEKAPVKDILEALEGKK